MESLLAFVLLVLSAWSYGAFLLPARWFRDWTDRVSVRTAAGLAVLSYGVFALGHLGLLFPLLLDALLLAPLVLAAAHLLRRRKGDSRAKPGRGGLFGRRVALKGAGLGLVALGATVATCGVDLLEALHMDGCPDRYHVIFAVSWLNNRAIEFLPAAIISCYPMNVEMLFVLGVLFEPESASSVIHAGFLPLTALAGYAVFRRMGDPLGAAFAVLWLMGQPMLHKFAPMGFNDLGAVFYATVAVVPLASWLETRHLRDLALAGFLAGMAATCKLSSALLVVLPLVVAVPVASWSCATWKRAVLGGLVLGACAVLAYTPWAIRNAVQCGSPFAPVLADLFPLDPEFEFALREYREDYDPRVDLFMRYPLQSLWGYGKWLVLEGSSAGAFLPVALLGLLVHCWRTRSRWSLLLLVALAVALLGFLAVQPIRMRYIFPAMPVMCLACAHVTSLILRPLSPRGHLLAAVLLAAGLTWWTFFDNARYRGEFLHRPLWTKEERLRFLSIAEPSWDRIQFLNAHLEPDDRLAVHRAHLRYRHLEMPFSPVSYWGPSHAEYLWQAAQKQEDPVAAFREGMHAAGITHLLVAREHHIFPDAALEPVEDWRDAVLYRVLPPGNGEMR